MGSGPDESERLVHLGLTWSDDGPAIRVRTGDASRSTLEPVIGRVLRHRSTDSRVCLGHLASSSNGSEYVDCRREPSSRKCDRCQTVDAVFAANMHQAHKVERDTIDRRFVGHLNATNWLYVAAFRDGSTKVGTSVDGRRHRRLAEQGAWSARFVARTADGFVVRELEDRVTVELGLSQAVPARRKLSGLVHPIETDELERTLDRIRSSVVELIERMGDSTIDVVDEAWRFSRADHETWSSLHPYPLDLGRGCHHVVVDDLCGRFAVVSSPGAAERFVVDLATLFGVVVEPGEVDSDELVVQGSLF